MTFRAADLNIPDLHDLIVGSRTAVTLRRSIGLGCLHFAVLALWLTLDTSIGPTNLGLRILTGVFCAAAAVSGLLWLRCDWMLEPTPCIFFGIFSQIGTACTVAILPDPRNSIIGCALFSVLSVQFTLLTASKWLVLHLIVSVSVIGVAAVRAYSQGISSATSIVVAAYVLAIAVIQTPWAARIVWSRLLVYAAQSRSDPLTGLLNRSGLDHALRVHTDRARHAAAPPMALAVLDIDRFKSVNDVHGHVVGDRVICEVAAGLDRLGSEIGASVARTGGEEFTVLIPIRDGQTLDDLAARLPLATAGRDGPIVTLSAGIVRLPVTTTGVTPTLAEVLTAADKMMYRAKSHGGATVVVE